MSLATVQKEFNDAILDGMARALWVNAWAGYVEDSAENANSVPSDWIAGPGDDWFVVSPDTPEPAAKAANDLAGLIAKAEGITDAHPMVRLFEQAYEADTGEPLELDPELKLEDEMTYTRGPSGSRAIDLAYDFGADLAHMAMGTGASWFDDHKHKTGSAEFDPDIPDMAIHFDGDELTWEGALTSGPSQRRGSVVQRKGKRAVYPSLQYANENDYEVFGPGRGRVGGQRGHTYVFRFGGFTQATADYVVVYATGIEAAVEELVAWVGENRPDSLMTAQVEARFGELLGDREMDDLSERELEAMQTDAEADTTQGDRGQYIASEDWSIVAEDPTPEQMHEIAQQARKRNPCGSKKRATR